MKHYVSLSEYPGKQGQYFYTEFFKLHQIDADYTPLVATKDTLIEKLAEVKKYASGISVSMPFKKMVIEHLDELDIDVIEHDSCNTILVKDGLLCGYNADLAGVKFACQSITLDQTVNILGNGAIGSMFQTYLCQNTNVNVYSRSLGNWDLRHTDCDVIINCTALGTISPESPLEKIPASTRLVIDLSVKQGKLIDQCLEQQVKFITGQDFYREQFKKQFNLYTGQTVGLDDYYRIAGNRE